MSFLLAGFDLASVGEFSVGEFTVTHARYTSQGNTFQLRRKDEPEINVCSNDLSLINNRLIFLARYYNNKNIV